MSTINLPQWTAFLGHQRVVAGTCAEVARALKGLDLSAGGLLVFDDANGNQIDYPFPAMGTYALPAATEADAQVSATPSVGRPRLGVVSREVTLLPRHWEWLGQQCGGASAALRRLVDEARNAHAERDEKRHARESSYRFMSAIGGDLPGFEEASRALFAEDGADFSNKIAQWPVDVQTYLAWLSRNAFPA